MLEKIKAVVFDLDGTIYYGSKIIEGVQEILSYIRENNKRIFFLTNNSTKSRVEIYNKLRNMGIDCHLEEVYSSGYVAGLYAKRENINNIFIFGSDNLKKEFLDLGINVVEDEKLAENLLIGYDPNFNYKTITQALHVALNGKYIIACNKERHFPGENAYRLPGCGAMVGAVELCANKETDFIIGKPNTLMLEVLTSINGLNKEDILMIGDTYESDIVMAQKFGCKSILISKEEKNDTIVVNKISDIKKYLK